MMCVEFMYSLHSFTHSDMRKSILLKFIRRKHLEQISNESKSSAAVELSPGIKCRKTGTWEGGHET